MRFNFHTELAKVKANPKHILPPAINQPIIDFLIGIGCGIGVEIVKKFQYSVDYGTIERMRDDVPNARITIQIDCGMVEGYKQFEIKKDGKWSAIAYKTVKNANLDKRKVKEKV